MTRRRGTPTLPSTPPGAGVYAGKLTAGMRPVYVPRSDLDRNGQYPVPILFDALVGEGETTYLFVKTLTRNDPGVSMQRVTPRWPHHLPGDLVIALTGQAAVIALHRQGVIDAGWRGHGVRIRDARFSAPVLLGECFYTRVEIGRTRRLGENMYVHFRFRMWKDGPDGGAVETYRSEQDAMFFSG